MSIITRTSTYASYSHLLGNVTKVQTSLFDAQNQLSSGLKTRSFEGFAGQVEQFVSLESKVRTVINYQENNAQNISRLETTKQAVKQIIDKVDEMENLMTLRRNPALAQDIGFEQQMNAMIRSVASELNITLEGKYLFSGTRTNQPPVAVPVTKPVTSGVPDDNYYQGSKQNVVLRADDNVEMEARIRADNSAFQKIFAAAHQSIEGHSADDDEVIRASLDMLQEGLEQVIALEASISADILAIENISQRQNSLQLYWTGVTEELSKTDILAVSTKLAVDETVLQASFQAFAGINQLRLVNFL